MMGQNIFTYQKDYRGIRDIFFFFFFFFFLSLIVQFFFELFQEFISLSTHKKFSLDKQLTSIFVLKIK